MAEPSRRISRARAAGVTLALLAAGATGFALGRMTMPDAPAPPPALPAPSPAPAPGPLLPRPEPPLGRAQLIAASARAADAFEAGQAPPEAVASLVGREFELRLPFGCPGDAGDGARYDATAEALRIDVQPTQWLPRDWLPAPTPEAEPVADAMEGFWIARPWTTREACPRAAATGSRDETLGIARIFTPDQSRVGRRDGKPYQAVETIAPDALDLSQGLRLRLRGRLAAAPGGGPVLCRAQGGARPVCLIIAEFSEVAVENPATGQVIATWDVATQRRD